MLVTWDLRGNPSKTEGVDRLCLNGGVWRIKTNSAIIATATMHSGFHIIKDGELKGSFTKHESLAYGVDWCRKQSNEGNIMASCSFYDHSLKLWEVKNFS